MGEVTEHKLQWALQDPITGLVVLWQDDSDWCPANRNLSAIGFGRFRIVERTDDGWERPGQPFEILPPAGQNLEPGACFPEPTQNELKVAWEIFRSSEAKLA